MIRATDSEFSTVQPASDDVSLNFRGAGIDGRADRVPQSAFQLVFHHEAVAAVDLDGIQGFLTSDSLTNSLVIAASREAFRA